MSLSEIITRRFILLILLSFLLIVPASCQDAYNYPDYQPEYQGRVYFSPSTVNINFFEQYEMRVLQLPDAYDVLCATNPPTSWERGKDSLIFHYNGSQYNFPKADTYGHYPIVNDQYVVYVRDDNKTVAIFDYTGNTFNEITVPDEIHRMFGHEHIFVITWLADGSGYGIYLLTQDQELQYLGKIQTTRMLVSYHFLVRNDVMYVGARCTIYKCSTEGVEIYYNLQPNDGCDEDSNSSGFIRDSLERSDILIWGVVGRLFVFREDNAGYVTVNSMEAWFVTPHCFKDEKIIFQDTSNVIQEIDLVTGEIQELFGPVDPPIMLISVDNDILVLARNYLTLFSRKGDILLEIIKSGDTEGHLGKLYGNTEGLYVLTTEGEVVVIN